jgi:hypothetical protein
MAAARGGGAAEARPETAAHGHGNGVSMAGLLHQASSLLDLRASGNRLGSLLHFLGVRIIGKDLPHSVRFFNKWDIDSEDPDINKRFAHQGNIATRGPKAHNPSDITTT